MKYFLLQIWILPLVRGILSFPQDNNLDFYNKHFGKSLKNHIQSKNHHTLEKIKFLNDLSLFKHYMNKRDVDAEKLSKIANNVQARLNNDNSDSDITSNCPEPGEKKFRKKKRKHYENYNKVVCQQVPGKIVCRSGKITFVINNKDHEMPNDVLQKFVVMANQRYGEGDSTFDVSVSEIETTMCPCYPSSTISTTCNEESFNDETPVIVECTLVSNEKLKMCNPFYTPSEKIYQCKTKKLGIKKRNILHIAVNQNGSVSQIQNPIFFRDRIRRKRELQRVETKKVVLFDNEKLSPTELNDYIELNEVTEDNDLSNLYYHSMTPFVRNFTDFCTLKFVNGWCEEYISTPACKITKLEVFTVRPCRVATEQSNFTVSEKYKAETGSTISNKKIVETIPVFTLNAREASLLETEKEFDHKNRRRMRWLGMQRFHKPMRKKNKHLSRLINDNKSLVTRNNSREYYTKSKGVRKINYFTISTQEIPLATNDKRNISPLKLPQGQQLTSKQVPATPLLADYTSENNFQKCFSLVIPFKNLNLSEDQSIIETTHHQENQHFSTATEKSFFENSINKFYSIQSNLEKYKEVSKSKLITKVPFENTKLMNPQNLLNHFVNQSEVKTEEIPSIAHSGHRGHFEIDRVKSNERILKNIYIEQGNSRNEPKFPDGQPKSIKNHNRRRRKSPLLKNLNYRKGKS